MVTATLLVVVAGITYLYFRRMKSPAGASEKHTEQGIYMNADADDRKARREKRRQWRRDERESRKQESAAWDAVLKRYFR